MDCASFHQHLTAYLNGDPGDPLFDELVEHEAACPACHEAAVAAMEADVSPGDDAAEVGSVLEQTIFSDCGYVEARLAESLDGALPTDVATGVARHLERCASCRRMRDVLSELPGRLAEFPALAVDRSFTREVLQRTIGPAPGVLDVLRALWRKPEFLWEASVACALVFTLLFGQSVPTYQDVARRAQPVLPTQAGVKAAGDAVSSGIEAATREVALLSARPMKRIEHSVGQARAFSASAAHWAERLEQDLRTRDSQGLLRELEAVLKPLGLYPRTPDPQNERNRHE